MKKTRINRRAPYERLNQLITSINANITERGYSHDEVPIFLNSVGTNCLKGTGRYNRTYNSYPASVRLWERGQRGTARHRDMYVEADTFSFADFWKIVEEYKKGNEYYLCR